MGKAAMPRYHFRLPPDGGLWALSRALAGTGYSLPVEGSPVPLRDVFGAGRAPPSTSRGLSWARDRRVLVPIIAFS